MEHTYERWRHGGWYVTSVRYPSGAVGCVSRNYPDRKWRIVCDERPGERQTYRSRKAAACAEAELIANGEVSAFELRKLVDPIPIEGVQKHPVQSKNTA